MRDTVGSAAAPAARWRNLRRGNFTAVSHEYQYEVGQSRNGSYEISTGVSVRLDVRRPDHLAPLLGFIGNELAEIGGRERKYGAANLGTPRIHLGIGEQGVDLLVELGRDLGGRVP